MPSNCFGNEELANLREVVESQDAWRWGKSNFMSRFECAFGEHLGRKYVHAANSGTSANTTACAALGLEPGDEIICPAVAPIFVSYKAVRKPRSGTSVSVMLISKRPVITRLSAVIVRA